MNIDRPSLPGVPTPGHCSAPASAPAPARLRGCADAPAPAPGSASARLSCTHADFDAARVADIRQRLSQGSYALRMDKVADGLLADLADLGKPGLGHTHQERT